MNVAGLVRQIGKRDAELAAKLYVNAETVARWRRGERVPRPVFRRALARLGGLTVEQVEWRRCWQCE